MSRDSTVSGSSEGERVGRELCSHHRVLKGKLQDYIGSISLSKESSMSRMSSESSESSSPGRTEPSDGNSGTQSPKSRPPLPPPPPPEVVQAAREKHLSRATSASDATVSESSAGPSGRRHALQEHSLERDAALSLRVMGQQEKHKHKRTSSIRNALKSATRLGPLRSSACKRRAAAGAAAGEQVLVVKSQPYELFEMPVTQRMYQRSRRRGAMMSADSRRQMSVDTIGLRQLTDEYLQNAGVKPISSSGQCSLVALNIPTYNSSSGLNKQLSSTSALAQAAGAIQTSISSSPTTFPIEAQLFQASKQTCSSHNKDASSSGQSHRSALSCISATSSADNDDSPTIASNNNTNSASGSQDSLGVSILPGNLPWQTDVAIQCEILRTPARLATHQQLLGTQMEPYETTGDLLNTLAGPYRGQLATSNQQTPSDAHGNQLSVTLKRGLTAISQHHLSPVASAPGAALHVVGSLKKSLSNTFDMSLANARTAGTSLHLQSQDSLPAYSSLQNEVEPDDQTNWSNSEWAPTQDSAGSGSGGIIGHLASKLGRQSSRKLTVGRKGLQRALSFDCRGYKRLELNGQQLAREQNKSAEPRDANILSASKQKSHNKSTLAINSDLAPRPYLAQSASQVDFQVPLLPYHKMQEAIVSQRRIDPAPVPPPSSASSCGQLEQIVANAPVVGRQKQPDADELICGQNYNDSNLSGHQLSLDSNANSVHIDTERRQNEFATTTSADWLVSEYSRTGAGCSPAKGQSIQEPTNVEQTQKTTRKVARKTTPPKLVLNIPTIATSHAEDSQNSTHTSRGHSQRKYRKHPDTTDDNNGEEVSAIDDDDSSKATVIFCLPSPNVPIDTTFNSMVSSPSFCIDQRVRSSPADANDSAVNLEARYSSNQLTATDVFSRSSNFIKRPSSFMADDAMNRVARALESSGKNHERQQQQQQVSTVLKTRRQAIVPPKLATDASNSDGEATHEPAVGQLIDVTDDSDQQSYEQNAHLASGEDEGRSSRYSSIRRKRSGEQNKTRSSAQDRSQMSNKLSSSQNALPTFYIESDQRTASDDGRSQMYGSNPANIKRPDSQMTNADSIASSAGSSTNLSMGARCRDSSAASPSGLSVTFATTARRRSSIAVIPQMQICPGDLLVYSKQLIDRMNQPEEGENQPPQFLTIDDKKGKNIWSSLKLFDNRSMKARNELLCSLEDVLASLQPSTFVDEQLSHYKGMLWNEFIYETESRRSASSEILANSDGDDNEQTKQANRQANDHRSVVSTMRRAGSVRLNTNAHMPKTQSHEAVKMSISGGQDENQQTSGGQQRASRISSHIGSRFREKPKLKRGQTVDSVFRIPLIPSSPLKHAQLHQQTPTAHLEEQQQQQDLMEDDERSSPSATSCTPPINSNRYPESRANQRSQSARPRSGSNQQLAQTPVDNTTDGDNHRLSIAYCDTYITSEPKREDSSFETDDAADLMSTCNKSLVNAHHKTTPNQIQRQSSLSTISSTITKTEQKRQRALWDLFQSECTFFFDHLMTLKNVYMEPLKKIQVEGFAMFADPDVLFGNLDELCCGVYDFCKEFLYIIMRTLKTRPEELNATDVLIKLYKKNPKIDHLRGVYHRYTLNYINALTYLESLRRQVEFVEFEKWSSRDVRCKKLQLTDLLVAPVQHIMRVPIILKDIESHTEHLRDRDEIRAILAVEEASLRELDDKMRWLKNFERLLEIQKNISWPNVLEMDPKLFIPDFLKEVLCKQPCEKLIVSPRRQIVHEGTLGNYDYGKASDMHVILFDDMLLITRRKKGFTKKSSTVCKTNSTGNSTRDDGTYKYIVYKQPLSLDRFYVHDVQQVDSQVIGIRFMFMLIVMNRFQQITNVHTFAAPNDDIKQTWLFKIKKTADRWKKNFSSSANNQTDQQANNLTQNTPTNTKERASAGAIGADGYKVIVTTSQPKATAENVKLNSNEFNDQPVELTITSASSWDIPNASDNQTPERNLDVSDSNK